METSAGASDVPKKEEVSVDAGAVAAPPVTATETKKLVEEVQAVQARLDEAPPPPVATVETKDPAEEVKAKTEESPTSIAAATEVKSRLGEGEAKVDEKSAVPELTSETKQPADDDEDVPDPDEDDLDDLDDMLDEFATVNLAAKKPEPAAPAKPEPPKTPAAASSSEKQPSVEDAFSEEEFAKQLQAGMADLLGEIEQSPDMQKQFEEMFKQIGAAAGAEDASPSKSGPPGSDTANMDASFQETIRRTMERMKDSGDQATAAAASGASDDFMSELLKQMSSGDLGGEGSEEEFSKMLMGMMEQLTNKEILYEPMKELDDKFPDWMAKNRDKTSAEDLKRYEEQQVYVRAIVAKFEERTYSDDNVADREFIVDRMQKMQAAGSPPPDLVGDMASAQEIFNAPDESCNPQ